MGNIVDREKYLTYLALCKERDKFLKSLQETNYHDWLIDKKLVEAGGIGKTVYIYPARGTNHSTSIRRIMELIESGRDVKVMTSKDISKRGLRRKHDLLEDVFSEELRSYVQKELNRQLSTSWPPDVYVYDNEDWLYPIEWKPIVRPDAYIYDHKYVYGDYLHVNLCHSAFKVVAQELVDELEDMK